MTTRIDASLALALALLGLAACGSPDKSVGALDESGESGEACMGQEDPNCWPGEYGVRGWEEGDILELGGLRLSWAFSSGPPSEGLARGYLHGTTGPGQPGPETSYMIHRVVDPSDCPANEFEQPDILGLESSGDLEDLGRLEFQEALGGPVFAGSDDGCPSGTLVLRNGDRFILMQVGAMDFVSELGGSSFTVRTWVGEPGVTDFSWAPQLLP